MHLKNKIQNIKNKFIGHRKIQTLPKSTPHPDIKPTISCKRKEYDFYPGTKQNKLNPIKLASKGWQNKKSRGDYFIIHPQTNEEIFSSESFPQLGIRNEVLENLSSRGIVQPTRIQQQAIPTLLSGKNTLIAAETGCGKTLAYLLPMLEQILQVKKKSRETKFNTPLGLILTPGRELAYQIESVAKSVVKGLDVATDVIVGGGTKRKMLNPEFKETDLLVATLGALSKLTTTGIYKMNHVRHVVLDEADTLLDESFAEKLAHFLKKFPFCYEARGIGDPGILGESPNPGTQLTLCSATLLSSLPNILSEIIMPESLVTLTTNQIHQLLNVPQRFLRLTKSIRPSHLLQLVKKDVEKKHPVIIFSNTSNTCDWVSLFLNENGVKCVNLNGDMSLNLRRNIFTDFQNDRVDVLSCTDVGSRGLDTIKVRKC